MFNQYGIMEIDGPPRAYFSWRSERVRYKTLYVEGKDPVAAVLRLGEIVEVVRTLLSVQPESSHILWWRERPSLEETTYTDERGVVQDDGTFVARCRLATTPDLPAEFWAKVVKPEGGLSPLVLVPSENHETQNSNASHPTDTSVEPESGEPLGVPTASFDPSEAA